MIEQPRFDFHFWKFNCYSLYVMSGGIKSKQQKVIRSFCFQTRSADIVRKQLIGLLTQSRRVGGRYYNYLNNKYNNLSDII